MAILYTILSKMENGEWFGGFDDKIGKGLVLEGKMWSIFCGFTNGFFSSVKRR